MIGLILPFTAVIVPVWLVRVMVGWKRTLEVLPAILVVGVSFGPTHFFWSNYVDSNLVDIVAGVMSIVATLAFLRVWKPRKIWRFDYDVTPEFVRAPAADLKGELGSEEIRDNANQVVLTHDYSGRADFKGLGAICNFVICRARFRPSTNQASSKLATTPPFTVYLPDGNIRPGPPGWDVPICTMRFIAHSRWLASSIPSQPASTSIGSSGSGRSVSQVGKYRENHQASGKKATGCPGYMSTVVDSLGEASPPR